VPATVETGVSERACQPQEWFQGSETCVSVMPAAGGDTSVPKGSRIRLLVLSVLIDVAVVYVCACWDHRLSIDTDWTWGRGVATALPLSGCWIWPDFSLKFFF